MTHETLVEVPSTRYYKAGYEVRTEVHRINDADPEVTIKSAYTPGGDYIGSSVWAFRLCNKRGIVPEKSHPDNNVCSIGFCEAEQKWAGWSHRAICYFGIGDKIFEERYGDDDTLFTQHGSTTIETLNQARQAAINFAEHVS